MTDAAPTEPPRLAPLAIAGDLTIQCAATRSAELHELLCAHLRPLHDSPADPAGAVRSLPLDLGALGDIDSAGLQILMAAQRLCERYGARLLLQPRSPSVEDALDTFWLDATLKPRARQGAHA